MKAVVLVGGEGTRLRPITDTVPKPLVPLVDRPILDHVLDHLARHEVREVVLSSSYLEHEFRTYRRMGAPTITWITETEPLGTGGAIVNALESLESDEPFFALNGDILTDLDLTAMLATHRERRAIATIALTHVDDARPFGLVPTGSDGRVIEFREKPAEPMPGDINAGTYVLEPSALGPWESGRNVSIEREIFPALIAGRQPVHGFTSGAYWIDLGTHELYLRASFDLLDGKIHGRPEYPAPFVADGADVSPDATVGRHVVVGPRASVAGGARVEDSVLHRGAGVGPGAVVRGSVLGPDSTVDGEAIDSVVGEGASVPRGSALISARIPPDESATSG